MKYFTQEDFKPSEMTLHIIRTIAHSYPPSRLSEDKRKYYWS